MKFYNFFKKILIVFKLVYLCIFKLEILNLFKIIFSNKKFILVNEDRIGHFSIDTITLFEVVKNNEEFKKKNIIIFNIDNKDTCNIFLKKKLIEKFVSYKFEVLLTNLGFIIPKIFKKTNIEIKKIYKHLEKLDVKEFYLNNNYKFIPIFKNVFNEGKIFSTKYSNVLNFSEEELNQYYELKKKLNLENYVCAIARDEKYLKINNKAEFNYHNYRNSNYLKLLKTANYLNTEKNLKVLRMGNIKSELSSKIFDENHIDFYDKSNIGIEDILLLSHCELFIGDTAGIVTIPIIFNKPSIRYNWIPIFNSVSHNSVIIPALIKRKNTNNFVSFRELYTNYSQNNLRSMRKSKFYEENDLEIVYNDENDILDATKNILSKDFFKKKSDNQLQFEKMMNEFKIYNPGIVSPLFLEKNLDLFI